MTYDACIKICRAYDTTALLGPVKGTGDMYDLGGLSFLRRDSAPVVVNHDRERSVGTVHGLVAWDFVDGRWIVARARLDSAPGWIRRGTPASFSSRTLAVNERNGWRIISRALIDEITIVSSTHTPVEALAEVALLKRVTATPEKPGKALQTFEGEVVTHGGPTLVRYFPGAITGVR